MRLHDGTKVMALPSVLYSTDSCVAAIDGGEGGFLHIRPDGEVFEDGVNVTNYAYSIYDTNGDLLQRGRDLYAAKFGVDSTLKAMGSLITFLTACAESKSEDSENYNLFPTPVREWAELYSDELSMIDEEIDQELNE